jgi:hypothetical protein
MPAEGASKEALVIGCCSFGPWALSALGPGSSTPLLRERCPLFHSQAALGHASAARAAHARTQEPGLR